MEYAVEYKDKLYIFETKQKQDTFLRLKKIALFLLLISVHQTNFY